MQNKSFKLPHKHNCIYEGDVIKSLWNAENLPECREIKNEIKILCIKKGEITIGQCQKMQIDGVMYEHNGIHYAKQITEIQLDNIEKVATQKEKVKNKKIII